MISMHAAFNRGIDAALATLGLEKTAVSAETIERLLAARQAQGVRLAPKVMGQVAQDLAAFTPEARSRLRNLALSSGESARGAAAIERAGQNPITQSMRERVGEAWESAMRGAPGVRSREIPLSAGYDFGATGVADARFGYSPEHIQRVMGEGVLIDPRKLMAPSRGAPRPSPVPNPAVSAVDRTGLAPYNPMAFEGTPLVSSVSQAPSPIVAPSRTAAPGDLTTPGRKIRRD